MPKQNVRKNRNKKRKANKKMYKILSQKLFDSDDSIKKGKLASHLKNVKRAAKL